LARKYRPVTFDQLIGQDAVVRTLTNAITSGRIAQGYMLTGVRGVGKTTTARLIARALNCIGPDGNGGPTPNPCGVCANCTAIADDRHVDVLEMDAASRTGIDDIRELLEGVRYRPTSARYKIYIVDEVHMLSEKAFNALLKTLEEPPPHVVFLFATTELHKVLDTIVSRCQVLKLQPLAEATIAARLCEVFRREGIEAQVGVAEALAKGARGGMRDALSAADRLLALSGGRPTLAELERLGGSGDRHEELLVAMERGARAVVLEHSAQLQGAEADGLGALIDALHRALLVAHLGENTPVIAASAEERALAAARAKRLGSERIETWLAELLRTRERMRLFAGSERALLEIVLLDLCDARRAWSAAELLARLEALEARLGGRPGPAEVPARSVEATAAEPRPAQAASRREAARGPERLGSVEPPQARGLLRAEELQGAWKSVLAELAKTHGAFAGVLERRARIVESAGCASLQIHAGDAGEARLVSDKRNQGALVRAASALLARAVELPLELLDSAGPRGPEEPSAAPRVRAAEDPFTRKVADLFGGTIEELS
jgi:DNA polymerase-3 subunit gamma/tau